MINPAESDRIHELCSRIAVERDHRIFLELVEELNRILGKTHGRLEEPPIGNRKSSFS